LGAALRVAFQGFDITVEPRVQLADDIVDAAVDEGLSNADVIRGGVDFAGVEGTDGSASMEGADGSAGVEGADGSAGMVDGVVDVTGSMEGVKENVHRAAKTDDEGGGGVVLAFARRASRNLRRADIFN
jgi:hypothetical protein